MKAAAAHVTPISFELGGKNAALVFADADLDAAVAGTAASAFTNSGQICLCTERVYVQREIYDRFVADSPPPPPAGWCTGGPTTRAPTWARCPRPSTATRC